MPHFAKPAEGSWTEHYPELGTAPVSWAKWKIWRRGITPRMSLCWLR